MLEGKDLTTSAATGNNLSWKRGWLTPKRWAKELKLFFILFRNLQLQSLSCVPSFCSESVIYDVHPNPNVNEHLVPKTVPCGIYCPILKQPIPNLPEHPHRWQRVDHQPCNKLQQAATSNTRNFKGEWEQSEQSKQWIQSEQWIHWMHWIWGTDGHGWCMLWIPSEACCETCAFRFLVPWDLSKLRVRVSHYANLCHLSEKLGSKFIPNHSSCLALPHEHPHPTGSPCVNPARCSGTKPAH